MKTLLLGFRVCAFIPGTGCREDRFELRQAAIECAQLCIDTPNEIARNHAYVEEITREKSVSWMFGDSEWLEEEQFKVIWEPEEVA